MNDGEALYRRANIEGNALGDEIVFFNDQLGKYFAVSPAGADIWKILETPTSLNGIVAKLLAQYAVDEATCRADTLAFLERMVAIDLVRTS